jgi:nicotinamide-nucleotide amidase
MRLAALVCLWSAAAIAPVAAGDAAGTAGPARPAVRYAIIVTGGELLSGAYPDSHTQFLTSTLRPLGLSCAGSVSVDDRPKDIEDALRFATQKASLVLVTGGLGPTDNDLTRETLSQYTGIALREHPDVLRAMEQRFGRSRDQLRANLRRQARVPSRGTYLKNSNGSAVGLVFELDELTIVALPGPPRELQLMVRAELVPYLSRRFGARTTGCSLTLRFVGLGQSLVDQTLKDHIPLPSDLTLSSGFEAGRVDFTFSLPDDTPEDRARLLKLKADILDHLGNHVYAEDKDVTLEQRVLRLLGERDASLVIADSGTAGLLAAGLIGCENDGDALAGSFSAPTEEDLRRLIGIEANRWSACSSEAERVALLARAAADRSACRCGLAIGQPGHQSDGDSTVEVALMLSDERCLSKRVRLRGAGQAARSRLATELLDLLRRVLE